MAVLPILITGEPVLHQPAREVTAADGDLGPLVADLFDTMDAAPGVGLAGPQVGVQLRIFVYGYTDEEGRNWRDVAINPELWVSAPPVGTADQDDDAEGCLSLPGERFPLLRSQRALLRASRLDGERYELVVEGWLARIFQHEYDHLDGILYADRLVPPLDRAVAKAVRKSGWGSPGISWLPGRDDLEG